MLGSRRFTPTERSKTHMRALAVTLTVMLPTVWSCKLKTAQSDVESLRRTASGKKIVDMGVYFGAAPMTESGELVPEEFGFKSTKDGKGYSGDVVLGRTEQGIPRLAYAGVEDVPLFLKIKNVGTDLAELPARLVLSAGWLDAPTCPADAQRVSIPVTEPGSKQSRDAALCLVPEAVPQARGTSRPGGKVLMARVMLKRGNQVSDAFALKVYWPPLRGSKAEFSRSVTLKNLRLVAGPRISIEPLLKPTPQIVRRTRAVAFPPPAPPVLPQTPEAIPSAPLPPVQQIPSPTPPVERTPLSHDVAPLQPPEPGRPWAPDGPSSTDKLPAGLEEPLPPDPFIAGPQQCDNLRRVYDELAEAARTRVDPNLFRNHLEALSLATPPDACVSDSEEARVGVYGGTAAFLMKFTQLGGGLAGEANLTTACTTMIQLLGLDPQFLLRQASYQYNLEETVMIPSSSCYQYHARITYVTDLLGKCGGVEPPPAVGAERGGLIEGPKYDKDWPWPLSELP